MKVFKKILKIIKKKIVIFPAMIAVLAIIVALVMNSLSKPAVGVINQTIDQQTSETVKLKDFKNQYFSTKYSSRYDLQSNKNSSASIQSWMLRANQTVGSNVSSTIAVSIAKLPAGGAKGDSSYKLFEAYPKLYKISSSTLNMESVIIANRTDPNFEQTALWAHKDYLLTISMTSGEKTDQLINEMDTILINLRWPE